MQIVSTYPYWAYFICFAAAAGISYLFYRNDKRLVEFSKVQISLLTIFRFLCLACIALLLLSPLLKYNTKKVEKPIIIFAQDNSQSIVNSKDSVFIKGEFVQGLNDLTQKLKEKYRLDLLTFGETINSEKTADFSEKITNYDLLFEELEGRYTNQNVGGLVFLSDGLYNEGSNPIYLADQIDYPIITVALGDTTSYKDARLTKVRNNKIAFLGNEFPVEIDLRVQKSKGQRLSLSIFDKSGEVFSKEIEVNSDDYLETAKATIKTETVGIQQYRVVLSELDGERNLLNNTFNFYIDVIDSRQRIAILSVAPHPDIAALKRSIAINENYQVAYFLIEDFEANSKDYDLIVLHQSVLNRDYSIDGKMRNIIDSKLPLLMVGGGWDLVGIQFGIKASKSANRRNRNEVVPELNANFTPFIISESLAKQIERFPPLLAYRSPLNNSLGNTVLLNQKIGAVSTKYPLLEFFEKDGIKVGRLYAENIWKWSLNDFIENKSHENFDELINKTIQFLAVKTDRSLFKVNSKNEYYENEAIEFDAQLFNDSYELIKEAEISLILRDENDKEYPYSFSAAGNAYRLLISSLEAGEYSYAATTTYKGKSYKEQGDFRVKALQLEQAESVADHNLLFQLAEKTGGKLFYPQALNQIADEISSREDVNSIVYFNEEVEDIINLKWIFFLLMFLLAVEWFIRKRGGAY